MSRKRLTGILAAALLLASGAVGGARATTSSQEPDGGARVSVEEFKTLLARNASVLVLDVRGGEIDRKIKGAVHIPLDQLEARLGELPREREIVTYCA